MTNEERKIIKTPLSAFASRTGTGAAAARALYRVEDQQSVGRSIEERRETNADVNERKEIEAELAAALLAAVVTLSDDAIYVADLDGVIIFWNQGAERLYGYTYREAVGQPVMILIPPECHDA